MANDAESAGSSMAPNPSQATLIRLAQALETTPGALSGSGLNLPPGHRSAATGAVLNSMTEAEPQRACTNAGCP